MKRLSEGRWYAWLICAPRRTELVVECVADVILLLRLVAARDSASFTRHLVRSAYTFA